MPIQLHTAKGRKGQPYKRASARKLGALNADLPLGALPFGEFSELKNYRKVRPTQIEVRTGYKTYPKTGNFTPLAKTEYRLDTAFRDVTFYYDGHGNLGIYILNALDGTSYSATLISGGITADTKVYSQQFNTWLVYTVLGKGVFAMQPVDLALTSWNAPIAVGKDLAATPKAVNFPDKTTGDLIIFDYITPRPNNGTDCQPLYNLNDSEPVKIRLAIEAPYFRADNANILALKMFNRWVLGTDDGKLPDSRSPEETDHLRTDAYGYKFVFVHETTDVKGQKFTWRSSPSVDLWVGDNIYVPPFLCIKNTDGTYKKLGHLNIDWAPSPEWVDQFRDPHTVLFVTTETTFRVLPSLADATYPNHVTDADFVSLRDKFKAKFLDTQAIGVTANTAFADAADPYYFTAYALGWAGPGTSSDAYFYQFPYKLAVPASELKSAPMTIFKWTDFSMLATGGPDPAFPPDVIAIEIYRTAYSQPDDKDNETLSPKFQPQRYGLVGTLKSGGSFTDDVATPDFGTSPDRYNGFLTDQFSGACMTIYNEDHLVLGDTETKYYVNAPSPLVQAFGYDYSGVGYAKADFTGNAGDGLPKMAVFIQYVDSDNNGSDLSYVPIDISAVSGDKMFFALTLPRGYAFNIQSVRIWISTYAAGVRTYGPSYTIPVTTHSFDILNAGAPDSPVTALTARPVKKVVVSDDPGAILWNAANELFNWPQENFIIIHQTAPVTGFGVTIGMLTVFCDRATWATDLGGRTEEKSHDVGLISRWANTAIQKIPFFLSQFGLYVSEPSGVRRFPNDVESDLLKYLTEEIPGVEPLANARRASMKFLGQRDELWLWMPSSADLGTYPHNGKLPARCFIYKIPGMREAYSYQFELARLNPSGRVIFNEHADGKLFAAYAGGALIDGDIMIPSLIVQDNDVAADWDGKAYWEMLLGLEEPEVRKVLRAVKMTAEVHAKLSRIAGLPRTDGIRSTLHGLASENASVKVLTIRGGGFVQPIYYNCSGSVFNTGGYTPVIRAITEPNGSGEHKAVFHSVEVLYSPKHQHPQ